MSPDTPLLSPKEFFRFLNFFQGIPANAHVRIDGFNADQCPGTIAAMYEFLQRYDAYLGSRFLTGLSKRRESMVCHEYGEPHRTFLELLWERTKPHSAFGTIFDTANTCVCKTPRQVYDWKIARYLVDEHSVIISPEI